MPSLNIAILSVSLSVYSTRRIAEEAEKRGHFVEQIDYSRCTVSLGEGRPRIFYQEEDISREFQVIIPRIGAKLTRHGAAIVKQFELSGCFSTARSMGITRARNKARTLQIMARKGVPVPKTLFSIDPDSIPFQLQQLGGPPVVIKLQQGTQGLGVILAESEQSARSVIDTFYKMDQPILVQEYIREAAGEDLRIIVVGNDIVAAMKRTGTFGEFRANVHRGGSAETVLLTPKEERMALEAVRYLGLGVAGVDIIRSNTGPRLLEVNASPGLQGIESATGINVAEAIVKYAEYNGSRKK